MYSQSLLTPPAEFEKLPDQHQNCDFTASMYIHKWNLGGTSPTNLLRSNQMHVFEVVS